MQLTGIHHLTAVTARAAENVAFYTGTLGLRLVKKTVNQDDVSAYHLFYADGLASPGTDITFFDWPVGRGVIIEGLQSERGRQLNGRVAEVLGHDGASGGAMKSSARRRSEPYFASSLATSAISSATNARAVSAGSSELDHQPAGFWFL